MTSHELPTQELQFFPSSTPTQVPGNGTFVGSAHDGSSALSSQATAGIAAGVALVALAVFAVFAVLLQRQYKRTRTAAASATGLDWDADSLFLPAQPVTDPALAAAIRVLAESVARFEENSC